MKHIVAAVLVGLTLTALPAKEAAASMAIPTTIAQVAHQKGVPPDIFYAVLLNETKIKTNMQRVVAWPWSANWQGRSYRFKTRSELYQFCQGLLDKGYESFDIGISQVNWKWHKHRFNNLWAATDPWVNMHAAADYLLEHYQTERNWLIAAGKYHAPNHPANAKKYRNGVLAQWKKIKGRS